MDQSLNLFLLDINECENYKCGGRCVNLPGSYLCECDKGYKLEGDVCVDEDECVTQKPCRGRCVNLIGSYRCECDAGYRAERHDCIGNTSFVRPALEFQISFTLFYLFRH